MQAPRVLYCRQAKVPSVCINTRVEGAVYTFRANSQMPSTLSHDVGKHTVVEASLLRWNLCEPVPLLLEGILQGGTFSVSSRCYLSPMCPACRRAARGRGSATRFATHASKHVCASAEHVAESHRVHLRLLCPVPVLAPLVAYWVSFESRSQGLPAAHNGTEGRSGGNRAKPPHTGSTNMMWE